MSGRLIYVMGPSGSGKDTLLQGLAGALEATGCHVARRVITRPADPSEPGMVPVTLSEFLAMEACGALAMAWRANGLAYGVARDIDDKLQKGSDVLVNGSRGYLPQALKRYANLVAILVAVDQDVLRERLRKRGRETEAQIDARMRRNDLFGVAGDQARGKMPNRVCVVDNSAGIEQALRSAVSFLRKDVACA